MAHDKAAIGGILDLLDRLGDGSCTTELSEELQQVVERVAEHGGKGTVTISLTVERVERRRVRRSGRKRKSRDSSSPCSIP